MTVPPPHHPDAEFIGSRAATYTPREPDAPNRGVLHMTDVVARSMRAMALAHTDPPHDWWDRRDPDVVLQTVPYNRNARAILAVPGMETNHRGYCYQLEMHDNARDGDKYSDRDLENLALRIIVPRSKMFGLPFVAYRNDGKQSDDAYGPNSSTRMTRDEWLNARRADGTRWGWCLHQNIPGNSHWDGPIDMGRLMAISAEIASEGEEPDMRPFEDLERGWIAFNKDEEWAVRLVQEMLRKAGYRPGAPDGKKRPMLFEALKEFGAGEDPTRLGPPAWRELWKQAFGIKCPEATPKQTGSQVIDNLTAEVADLTRKLEVSQALNVEQARRISAGIDALGGAVRA